MAEWTSETLLQTLRSRVAPTSALFGMEVIAVDVEAGTVTTRFTVRREMCNPMGNLQGGIFAVALDDAAALALMAAAGRPIMVPTLEFKVSFFGPAPLGSTLQVIGRTLKMGRTVVYAEADLTDEGGKLLARMSTTCVVRDFPDQPMFEERKP